MKIIDKPLIRRIREQAQGQCEFCGQHCRQSLEVHHIHGRGPGRVDIPGELIALGGIWDCACHHMWDMTHGEERRRLQWSFLTITAKRLRTSPEAIEAEVYRLRQLHKYAEVRRDA